MSENLDLVRSIYAGWERGDWGFSDWADEEIELVFTGGPSPSTFKGHDASSGSWRDWLDVWKDFRTEALDYRVLDGQRVVVFGRMGGIGKLSGTSTDTETVNVFHIRDRKVVRLVLYSSVARAVADLGLEE